MIERETETTRITRLNLCDCHLKYNVYVYLCVYLCIFIYLYLCIYVFMPCHRNYGHSEYRKAIVHRSLFQRTFPSISAKCQRCHTQPSHSALRFLPVSFNCCLSLDYVGLAGHCIFYGMVKIATCIFMV